LGLGNLGDLFRMEGRLFAAATAYRQSLALLKARLGPGHPSVARVSTALAEVVRSNRWQNQQTVSVNSLLKH
jgi:hypothetical protein